MSKIISINANMTLLPVTEITPFVWIYAYCIIWQRKAEPMQNKFSLNSYWKNYIRGHICTPPYKRGL